LALAAGAACAAQDIEVEEKGTYIYWFTYRDAAGEDQLTAPGRFKGKSAEVDVKALGEEYSDAKLHVINKSTGNMAIVVYMPPEGEEPKPIELSQDDFEFVKNVRLKIVAEDGAVLESAIVDITDGEGTRMRAVVTPADEGVASFEDVATGEINVKVTAEGLTKTIDSDINLPEERETPGFAADVKVAGDVRTLPKPAEGTKESARKTAAEGAGAPSGLIFQTIAGIILIIVVIAVIYAILKSRGVSPSDALRQMGAQVPADQQAQAGTGVATSADTNVCPFCGQIKDASGNCACTVTPGVSPAGTPTADSGAGPRLVGTQGTYSGQVFEITTEQAMIGRESGDIMLPNDNTVSRRHATIAGINGEYTIRDEGSSNGVFVNGAKVTEQKLTPGDEIQLGATKFRFEV